MKGKVVGLTILCQGPLNLLLGRLEGVDTNKLQRLLENGSLHKQYP